MRQAAVYARVSTVRQSDNDRVSLPDQIRRCREAAERSGYTVPGEFVFQDAVSGEKDEENRPGFGAMIAAGRGRQFEALFFWSLDRLARDTIVGLKALNELEKNGVAVRSVSEPGVVENQAVRTFMLGWAQEERERIKARTQGGRAGARARGRWTNGMAPYGLRLAEGGQLQVDPIEGPLVREMFDRIIAGHGRIAICRWLNETGVLPPIAEFKKGEKKTRLRTNDKRIGSTWEGLSRFMAESKLEFHTRKPIWVESAVWKIVTNPIYTGRSERGDTYDIQPAALVAASTHRQANAVMTERWRKGKVPPESMLLTGRLVCGHPGCVRAYSMTRSGRAGGYLNYYQCLGRRHGVCDNPSVRADATDAIVAEKVSEFLVSRLGSQDFLAALTRDTEKKLGDLQAELRLVQERKDSAEKERASLLDNIRYLRAQKVGEAALRDDVDRLRIVGQEIEKIEAQEVELLSDIAGLERSAVANDREVRDAVLRGLIDLHLEAQRPKGVEAEFLIDPKEVIALAVERVYVHPSGSLDVRFREDPASLAAIVRHVAAFALRANRRLTDAQAAGLIPIDIGPFLDLTPSEMINNDKPLA
ncbi:hypothetical protein GAY31_19255 [Azospirillum brasilense]|nr:hypothetical protein [Azospirillum brasilense]